MNNSRTSGSLFLLSFVIVAFGQLSWVPWLAPIAGVMGFALFWRSLLFFATKFVRFWVATFWFTCVQLIQLSWMTAIEFQGVYILFAYCWLASWLGVQFGLLSLLIPQQGPMKVARILATAALWTLFEWARFYFLCGFSWNPSGLALTTNLLSLQMASIGGVLGLSFWVILVNGFAFNVFECFTRFTESKVYLFKIVLLWVGLAAVPYLFGLGHLAYYEYQTKKIPASQSLTVALVQTGLLPSEKLVLPERVHQFISPWEQWRRILGFLKKSPASKLDLIVLPEVAVPFHCNKMVYPQEAVVDMLIEELGPEVCDVLPPLQLPFAERTWIANEQKWLVSNSFWTQALSNYFQAEVVIGLEDEEKTTQKSYNAAFYFVPKSLSFSRYEKQVLLPMAEYLPSKLFQPFVETYGIQDFFTKGSGTKVFTGRIPFSISICYEETFPDLVREGRLQGAEILVNVTNDNWYPSSKLPKQHFDLGRLRAVENGMPLFRACNTGVSAIIDAVGRPLCIMGELDEQKQYLSGALVATVPIYHHHTLYTLCGDGAVVGLAWMLCGIFWRFKKRLDL